MSSNTKIQWTDYTFGWFGCTKVSEGCAECYMFELARRFHDSINVGPGRPRILPKYFTDAMAAVSESRRVGVPFTWDREHKMLGTRGMVFPSLCDPFDAEVPIGWLFDLITLARLTRHLDWQLLTKRPELIRERLTLCASFTHSATGESVEWESDTRVMIDRWLTHSLPPQNIFLGCSVENQKRADERISELLKIPATVHFLSCEPLLGPVNLEIPMPGPAVDGICPPWYIQSGIDWVIVGGESGKDARPSSVDDIRGIVQQCQAARVPVFVKQLGAKPTSSMEPAGVDAVRAKDEQSPRGVTYHWRLDDKKGGNLEEWPHDLRVRESVKVGEKPMRLAS